MALSSRVVRTILVTIAVGGVLLLTSGQAFGEDTTGTGASATTEVVPADSAADGATAVLTSESGTDVVDPANGEGYVSGEDAVDIGATAGNVDGVTVTSDMLRDGVALENTAEVLAIDTDGMAVPVSDGATVTSSLVTSGEVGFVNFNFIGWALMLSLLVLTLVGIGISIREDKQRKATIVEE